MILRVMTILIIYSTLEGQSQKVAARIAMQVRDAGCMVELTAVESATLESFFHGPDAIIIVASVHVGKHAEGVVRWVKAHTNVLNNLPTAFVSVSLSASDEAHRPQAENCVQEFLQRTGWQPTITATIGGALAYTKYNFIKRFVVKQIAKQNGLPTDTSRDYEFTDWSMVTATTNALLAATHTATA